MAAVVNGVTLASSLNQAAYVTGSFTPTAGDVLVLFACITGSTLLVATSPVTDSLGGTWTPVGTSGSTAYALKAASVDGLWCFVRDQFSTGAAMTVTITSNAAGTGAIMCVARVSGLLRTGGAAIRQAAHQDNLAGGSTPAPAFAVVALTENPTLGFVANLNNPATLTPPTNWTELADIGYGTPTTGGEYVSRDSGFTSTTITWGSTSTGGTGDIILELSTLPFMPGSHAGLAYPPPLVTSSRVLQIIPPATPVAIILPILIALQRLLPKAPNPQWFLAPSQAGDPLLFPALFRALQKLNPNAPSPALFIAPAQAGDPLLFFNVIPAPYSFRTPAAPPSALFLTPAQAGDPLLFFNVTAPSWSFARPQWLPPTFQIAPILIVIPPSETPLATWWWYQPFDPF